MKRSRLPLVSGFLLVPLLGTLVLVQVRWLGEVETARRHELERHLEGSLERAAEILGALDPDLVDAPPEDAVETALVQAFGSRALQDHVFALLPREGDGLASYTSDDPLPSRPPDAAVDAFTGPLRWVFHDEDGSPTEGELEIDQAGIPGAWSLVAWSRSGPLAEVVARGRRANLWIGGGLLALVCATVALLWVGESRARRLAERELAFVAGVSHDLRTPLAVIRSAASNLSRGVVHDAERTQEYGRMIEREVERVGARVERVLRLSRGIAPADFAEVELASVIDEAIRSGEPWRDRREFRIEVDLPLGLPPLHGDAAALSSALGNLVDNAIKYGPDGQTIRITAEQQGGEVHVSVRDEGDGVPRAERRRIFEPFQRAHGEEAPGSGLGLSVVARVAADHGGSASVEDDSTFVLRLPLAQESRS